jgi:Zn-dependent protease
VALAGPFANLVQALLGTGIFRLFMGILESGQMNTDIAIPIMQVLASYVYLNLMLMFFNLIPLPPLDGSAIISPLLRGRAREAYYQVQRYSMPVLLAIMFLVPMVFHVDPLGIYLRATAGRAADLILSI